MVKRTTSDGKKSTNKKADNTKQASARSTMVAPNDSSPRYNYDTYEYEYFCGANAKVFFGDVWADDIVTIQFSTNQNKTPIYGYASQNYDAVAKGQFIIEGSMTIAFKEVGYLNVIQALLEQQRHNLGAHRGDIVENVGARLVAKGMATSENINTSTDFINSITPPNNLNPSLIRKAETIESILDNLRQENVGTITTEDGETKSVKNGFADNSLIYNTSENKLRDFEDVAELMEDSIWGDSNGKSFDTKEFNNKFRRTDEFDYKFDSEMNPVGIKGWNRKEQYSNCLNIMMTFGDMNDYRAEHTLMLLNDVHFKSQGMIVTPDGNPVAETYTFFARDINRTLYNYKNAGEGAVNLNPLKFYVGQDPVTVAKMEDIKAIQDVIDFQHSNITIRLMSYFDDEEGKWKYYEDRLKFDAGLLKGSYKGDVGFTTKFNQYVEDATQEYVVSKIPAADRPSKISIEVVVETQPYNYILEKSSVGINYKITSPAINDFVAMNIVNRSDFFVTGDPKEAYINAVAERNAIRNTTDFTAQQPGLDIGLKADTENQGGFSNKNLEGTGDLSVIKHMDAVSNTTPEDIQKHVDTAAAKLKLWAAEDKVDEKAKELIKSEGGDDSLIVDRYQEEPKTTDQTNQEEDTSGLEEVLGGVVPQSETTDQTDQKEDPRRVTATSPPLAPHFDEYITSSAEEFGVDPNLISAVIKRESDGNPNAVSYKRDKQGKLILDPQGNKIPVAYGTMQLTKTTADALGVKDVFNPEENIRGGTKLLKELSDTFPGDNAAQVASFNWNPKSVKAAKDKYGDDWKNHLPKETQTYVANVMTDYTGSSEDTSPIVFKESEGLNITDRRYSDIDSAMSQDSELNKLLAEKKKLVDQYTRESELPLRNAAKTVLNAVLPGQPFILEKETPEYGLYESNYDYPVEESSQINMRSVPELPTRLDTINVEIQKKYKEYEAMEDNLSPSQKTIKDILNP